MSISCVSILRVWFASLYHHKRPFFCFFATRNRSLSSFFEEGHVVNFFDHIYSIAEGHSVLVLQAYAFTKYLGIFFNILMIR